MYNKNELNIYNTSYLRILPDLSPKLCYGIFARFRRILKRVLFGSNEKTSKGNV